MHNVDIQQLEHNAALTLRNYIMSMMLFRNTAADYLGVNTPDIECVVLVLLIGPAAPSQIARYTGLSSGAVTAMLNRLEEAQLIKRTSNPRDRRGSLIHPGKKAIRVMRPTLDWASAQQNELFAHYSKQELAQINGFLRHQTETWESATRRLLL